MITIVRPGKQGRWGLCVLAFAAFTGASAQELSTNENLMLMAGRSHAVAELCGYSTKSKLQESKQELRNLSAQRGISGARFEALFSRGYSDSQSKIAAATPQQRVQACKQLAAMGKTQ